MPELQAETRAEAVVDALGLLYHDDLDPDEFMLFPEDDAPTIETVREHLERSVPPGKCGFGHTAMIQFRRGYCTARNPACLDGPRLPASATPCRSRPGHL